MLIPLSYDKQRQLGIDINSLFYLLTYYFRSNTCILYLVKNSPDKANNSFVKFNKYIENILLLHIGKKVVLYFISFIPKWNDFRVFIKSNLVII